MITTVYVICVLLAPFMKSRKIRYDKEEVNFSFQNGISPQVKAEVH